VADLVGCALGPEAIVTGEPTVLVGGLPEARLSDSTGHAGTITKGAATVLVGDGGGGSAAGAPSAIGIEAGSLDPAQCEACWDDLVASDAAIVDAWRLAALADGRPLSQARSADPKADFACFAMLFAKAARTGLGSAQALYRSFPNRFRVLDLYFPNGMPKRPPEAGERGRGDP
jgi:hypothetical protein